mgnify:CR=1 FL=1
MELAKNYDDIQWTEVEEYNNGTKLLISEPLAMSSAAGWYLLSVLPVLRCWRSWDYRHWMLFWAFWGALGNMITSRS